MTEVPPPYPLDEQVERLLSLSAQQRQFAVQRLIEQDPATARRVGEALAAVLVADQQPRLRPSRRRWLTGLIALAVMGLIAVATALGFRLQHSQEDLAQTRSTLLLQQSLAEFWEQRLTTNFSTGEETRVIQLLDAAVIELDRSAPGDPRVELTLRDQLSKSYRALALYPAALEQRQRTLALQRTLDGADSAAALRSEIDQASLLIDATEVQRAADQLLPLYQRPQLSDRLRLEAGIELARAALVGGEPTTAADLLEELSPLAADLPAEGLALRWRLQQTLAIAQTRLGRLTEAVELFEALIASKREQLGDQHPDLLRNRSELATALDQLGAWERAAETLRSVHETQVALLGPEHPSTLATEQSLAKILIERGELDEGADLLAHLGGIIEREFGAEHPQMLFVRNLRASLLVERGELAAAEAEYRSLIESHRRGNGIEAPEALIARNNLAGLLVRQGRSEEALELYFLTQEDARKTIGEGHYLWGIIASNYGDALLKAGRASAAVPVLERSLRCLQANLPADHERLIQVRDRLAAARANSALQ